ncbi:MAG: accessory gene regulator B family protein [Clostridia bacterium]|nr:accessory gene regulator B family protein [Clostridia bacterium]
MISKISEGITRRISENLPDISKEKAEHIEYGLYMLISELYKILLILMLSYILGVLAYTIVVIFVLGLMRNFLGGVHAKTHIGCLISYSAVIFGIIGISSICKLEPVFVLVFTAPLSFILAYKYAPADDINKPILSRKQRKRLRKFGFITLTSILLSSIIVPTFWAKILLFTCIAESITLTPIVYKITGNKYGFKEEELL